MITVADKSLAGVNDTWCEHTPCSDDIHRIADYIPGRHDAEHSIKITIYVKAVFTHD